MIEWMSNWAQGIITAVIIATVIEMILPQGHNQKYIKMVLGIYILFAMITPIIQTFTKEDFEFNLAEYEKYFQDQTYEVSSKAVEQKNDQNIQNIYVSNLKQDMKQKLKEKGYEVVKIELEAELEDQEQYGNLKGIRLQVKKKQEEDFISQINTVNRIEIENRANVVEDTIKEQNNKDISEKEKKEIKEYLNDTYSVEKNKIIINE